MNRRSELAILRMRIEAIQGGPGLARPLEWRDRDL
jgi:hypothetical protein